MGRVREARAAQEWAESTGVVALDIGGVLLTTIDDAHLTRLSELTGQPVPLITAVLHDSGLYDAYDAGRISEDELAERLREGLGAPGLTVDILAQAWNLMLGETNPVLCALAARLAAEDRLVLATNSNPWHAEGVRARLAAAGLPADVPFFASYMVKVGKPEPGYYRALREVIGDRGCLAFVDDRERNVVAAAAAGLPAWHHRDAASTAAHLETVAWP